MDNNEFRKDMFIGDIEVPKELEIRIKLEVDSIKAKKKGFFKVISASAAVLIIFILSVSFIPPLRACAKNIPFLNVFIDLIHKDEGLKKANENGYLPISKSITTRSNGYEFSVGNIFMDEQRMNFVCVIKPDKSVQSDIVTEKSLKKDEWRIEVRCKNMNVGVISSNPIDSKSIGSLTYSYNCLFTDLYYYKRFMASKPSYLDINIIKYLGDSKKEIIIGRVKVPFSKKYIQKAKTVDMNYSVKSKQMNLYIETCIFKRLNMSPTMMTLQIYIKPKKGFVNPVIDGVFVKDMNGKVSNTSPSGIVSSNPDSNNAKGAIQSIYLMPSLYYEKNIKKLYVGFKNVRISEEHGEKSFIIDTAKKGPVIIKFDGRKIIISNVRIKGKYLIFDTKTSYYMKNPKDTIGSFTESYEEEYYRNWAAKTYNADAYDIQPNAGSFVRGNNGYVETTTQAKIRVFNSNQKKYVIFIRDINKSLNIKSKYLIKRSK